MMGFIKTIIGEVETLSSVVNGYLKCRCDGLDDQASKDLDSVLNWLSRN